MDFFEGHHGCGLRSWRHSQTLHTLPSSLQPYTEEEGVSRPGKYCLTLLPMAGAKDLLMTHPQLLQFSTPRSAGGARTTWSSATLDDVPDACWGSRSQE